MNVDSDTFQLKSDNDIGPEDSLQLSPFNLIVSDPMPSFGRLSYQSAFKLLQRFVGSTAISLLTLYGARHDKSQIVERQRCDGFLGLPIGVVVAFRNRTGSTVVVHVRW